MVRTIEEIRNILDNVAYVVRLLYKFGIEDDEHIRNVYFIKIMDWYNDRLYSEKLELDKDEYRELVIDNFEKDIRYSKDKIYYLVRVGKISERVADKFFDIVEDAYYEIVENYDI